MPEKPRFSTQEGVVTEKEHIDLKAAGQDGSVVQFRRKRHTPLDKLMKTYCCRQVLPNVSRHRVTKILPVPDPDSETTH